MLIRKKTDYNVCKAKTIGSLTWRQFNTHELFGSPKAVFQLEYVVVSVPSCHK